jgi:hypothetical protein
MEREKELESSPAEPLLEIIKRDGDVLCVLLVEDPDLATSCRCRYSVSVVVEQDSLVLCSLPKGRTQLLGVFDGRVEVLQCVTVQLSTARTGRQASEEERRLTSL